MNSAETLHYRVVDVFTQQALQGNALAVFLNGSKLNSDLMQRIARELNLSETVFLLPPSEPQFAARLRIFTPKQELAFAGHPTIGAASVLLTESLIPQPGTQFLLEEQIGGVSIRVDTEPMSLIWLRTPAIQEGPIRSREVCARVLGLTLDDLLPVDPQIVTAGNPTLLVPLRTREAVDRAWLEMAGLQELRGDYPDTLCCFVFAPTLEGAYSRMFGPAYGIAEDPATGSSTGPLAAYMRRHKLLSETSQFRFVSEQGSKMGRRSLLYVRIDPTGRDIEIGGYVTPLTHAVMTIPLA